ASDPALDDHVGSRIAALPVSILSGGRRLDGRKLVDRECDLHAQRLVAGDPLLVGDGVFGLDQMAHGGERRIVRNLYYPHADRVRDSGDVRYEQRAYAESGDGLQRSV